MLKKADFYLLSFVSSLPLAVLIGAVFGIDISQVIFPALPSMVPLTAIGILLGAGSLYLQKDLRKSMARRLPGLALALLGAGLLLIYATTDWIDSSQKPRFFTTSARSASTFLAFGLGQILFGLKNFRLNLIARNCFQAVNIFTLAVSTLAILGYFYQVTHLFGLSSYIGMSILTAVSIFGLSICAFRLESDYGLVRMFNQDNSAGVFVRNFVVLGLTLPFVVAGLIRYAQLHFDLAPNFVTAAFVIVTLLSILILGISTTKSLEQLAAHEIRLRLQEAHVEQANEAARLRERFLANMSHEVRTPLTAVLGYLDFLNDTNLNEKDRQRFTARAKSGAMSLLRVLDNILDLSKSNAEKIRLSPRTFSPNELVNDIVSQFYLEATNKNVEIVVELDAKASLINMDANRLQQILTNLLSNAVKFTDHGQVRVRMRLTPKEHFAEGLLSIAVADTGIGIPEHAQKLLFTSFYQVDDSITRRYGGSGIGLALSQNLARLMGGKLRLNFSELNRGSEFEVEVPFFYPEPVLAEAVDVDPAEEPHDLSVLLVEDNEDNQFLISRYLTDSAVAWELAENGSVAVEKARMKKYDVILMDVQMPVMGGLEATQCLRQAGYNGPIIALSAHSTDEHRATSLKAGCNAHICKPIDRAELLWAIRKFSKDR